MELQFKNVTKEYGNVHAVEHVTHSMGKGVYGLLGVNGAGKTTLMRMICTAITPTSGEILWNGKDIFSLGASYREILGYLPQSYGFYPDLSVYDYMLYIASIKGIRPIMAKKRALKLLEQVGMAEKRKRKMRTLSGGMIRRVGIAQAMLNDPRILVLDEPTAGLDPNERIRFRNLISELSEDRLVLLSTQYLQFLQQIPDLFSLHEFPNLRCRVICNQKKATINEEPAPVEVKVLDDRKYQRWFVAFTLLMVCCMGGIIALFFSIPNLYKQDIHFLRNDTIHQEFSISNSRIDLKDVSLTNHGGKDTLVIKDKKIIIAK